MRSASFALFALSILIAAPAEATPGAAIKAAVANPARLDSDKPRDKYRHPAETLGFFGIEPSQTVIEYSPGGGWYTRILMPLLVHGHYIAVVGNNPRAIEGARKLIAPLPGSARADVNGFDIAAATMAKPNSVDRVLTFRNIHNLLMPEDGGAKDGSVARAFFRAAFKALKPGGMLGVVDHRLPEKADSARENTSHGSFSGTSGTTKKIGMRDSFLLQGILQSRANKRLANEVLKTGWSVLAVQRHTSIIAKYKGAVRPSSN